MHSLRAVAHHWRSDTRPAGRLKGRPARIPVTGALRTLLSPGKVRGRVVLRGDSKVALRCGPCRTITGPIEGPCFVRAITNALAGDVSRTHHCATPLAECAF
jgi:hypothetical protein